MICPYATPLLVPESGGNETVHYCCEFRDWNGLRHRCNGQFREEIPEGYLECPAYRDAFLPFFKQENSSINADVPILHMNEKGEWIQIIPQGVWMR